MKQENKKDNKALAALERKKLERRKADKDIIKNIQFSWVGIDKRGKEVSGDIQAVSEINAKLILRGRGIAVKKIKKTNTWLAKKVKPEDVSAFTRQLATMMKAGVPLMQSFDIVANGHENPSVSKLLYDIKNDVETGTSLAKAFAKHPDQFDDLFCNLIAAGEKAGILDQILDKIALYQEKMLSIKKKIKSALTYPIAIMGVATIVSAILMIFVVPSFKSVFESFGAELPMPTQVVINISDFFVAYWYIMFGSVAGALIFLANLLKKSEKARNKRDELLLRTPIFGKIVRKAIMARWARTLATMSTAGVPLVEALDSVAGASGNYVYLTATKNIQKDVSTGTSLTISMNDQKVFPNMMIQMTQIGEESGSVDMMLNKVAESFEEEVDNAIASLSSLMEPLIISFLGIVVGGLVVAMYLPIFKMAGAV
jgi:type IV pilus assembly protein PilC